ncbi:MAG: DUF255 domain-containing protein [Euryarchaeota archaeon]|nr:DUF255 domain-containing protein [Euryarchaeota archaeon]
MKNLILILGITVVVAVGFWALFANSDSQSQNAAENQIYNLNWTHDLNKALKEAKNTNKPIMIDFYSAGCSWCQKLDEETFSDPRVVEKLSQNYILVKIDLNNNPELAAQYQVYAVPTLVFLDVTGQEIKRQEGYLNPDEFLSIL